MTNSSPIRTVIADDEPIARDGLRALLERDPEIEIVAECSTGDDTLTAVIRLRPDLLLLDVQMPDLDGFGVMRSLPADLRPAVIFVTAYDKYALRAFDLHAVDYLLKPFGDGRAREAIERAKQRIRSAPASDAHTQTHLNELLRHTRDTSSNKPLRRIAVREGERIVLVPTDSIEWIEAEGDYIRIHAGGAAHLVRSSLRDVLEQLDEQVFVRIHRSAVVNVDQIRELVPVSHGDFEAVLANGQRLKVSRTQRAELARRTGNLF